LRPGQLLFLPVPVAADGNRVGGAIVDLVSMLLRGEPEMEEPNWAEEIRVPGADAHDARIASLGMHHQQLKNDLHQLEENKGELLRYKHLLFGTGKAVLESAVRAALRLVGFEVPEPEQYMGEWDVELRLPDRRTAIGEVEGAEGVVSVDKFRQLLHYLSEEELEGRSHKGILIGNGFRNQAPLTRPDQFSEHVKSASAKFGVTSALFKCFLSILEKPEDEGLRENLRERLFGTVGPWVFAGPQSG
jgi:hypothetical protein